MKQYVLRDGEEAGIYTGIGVVEVGKPITAYGEAQAELLSSDKRFKVYTPPKEKEEVEASKPAEKKAKE